MFTKHNHCSKQFFGLIAIFFSVLALGACADLSRVGVTNLTSAPQDRGIVVFSTGAAKTNLTASTMLMLVNGASHKRYDRIQLNFDYPFPSDFPGEHANLRSLSLPEGTYYLIPDPVNWALRLRRAPIYRFHVSKGKISYLGSLYFNAPHVTFLRTNASRDIDLFFARNPGLARETMTEDYMTFDSEYSVNDRDAFQLKGVIFGAP